MEQVDPRLEKDSTAKIDSAQGLITKLMEQIDVQVNGSRPWDIQIHNQHFYQRVLDQGGLGLGESYMDHWWDCEALDRLFDKVLRARLDRKATLTWQFKLQQFIARYFNFQSKQLAKKVAYKHYNLGNPLFEAMLDPKMIYSCGYWRHASNLADAQTEKLKLICEKLKLQKNETLLDVGCGWGGLAKYAAENYGVNVVGVTISEQQYQYAKKYCAGLPIEIRLQDYRDVSGQFDKIVSVGMFEHVGHLNYRTFMEKNHQLLAPHGLFLLHTIGSNESVVTANAWIAKYIFPRGMLPSIAQISKACEKLFVMEDWQNFGTFYDPTLMAWHENFERHWPILKKDYDQTFYRMWRFYLLSCAGSFRARLNQLWQVVFSKYGVVGGYMAPR